jgi:hypothetical protein
VGRPATITDDSRQFHGVTVMRQGWRVKGVEGKAGRGDLAVILIPCYRQHVQPYTQAHRCLQSNFVLLLMHAKFIFLCEPKE